ncbi:MAG: YkgJ family cysteine cluster protein [Candidatus Bathyarchaeia archaeon]
MRGHRCKRSGDCCVIHLGSFEATDEDIVRWKRQGRVDILKHIAIDSTDPHNRHGVFVTKSCPFLKREETGLYSCAIHETKPFYCRIYPDDGMCEHEESIED